jgi:hypothetical protein
MTAKNTWSELGLRESYDTGELIVLLETEAQPLSQASQLLLEGPLGSSARKMLLGTRRGPGDVDFFEFYALSPGVYTVKASWGEANFEVVGRENLPFRMEFGIFSIVVALLVGIMAWKYLIKERAR